MLGVIICPHCTLVQGADLTMARVTCPRCGGKIDVKRAKVYFSTDSPQELADGVRRVGASLFYDIETLDRPTPPAPVLRVGIPTNEDGMRATVRDLTAGGKSFTKDELKRELRTEDDEAIDRLLARMLSSGLIFESSPGRYRPA